MKILVNGAWRDTGAAGHTGEGPVSPLACAQQVVQHRRQFGRDQDFNLAFTMVFCLCDTHGSP